MSASPSMNLSYNAALTLLYEILGWKTEKAKFLLRTELNAPEPADRDAPGLVPVTILGRYIHQNYCDRNNQEY